MNKRQKIFYSLIMEGQSSRKAYCTAYSRPYPTNELEERRTDALASQLLRNLKKKQGFEKKESIQNLAREVLPKEVQMDIIPKPKKTQEKRGYQSDFGKVGIEKRVEARKEAESFRMIVRSIADASINKEKAEPLLNTLGITAESFTNKTLIVATLFKLALSGNIYAIKMIQDELRGEEENMISAVNVKQVLSEAELELNKHAELRHTINDFWAKAQRVNPLYTKKPFVLLEGGRASGKTFGGADIVLYEALTRSEGTIICGREIQNSIKESSKAMLEQRITAHGIGEYFEILQTEIRAKDKPVKIIFLGLREATRQDTIKGITNAVLVWVDEAQSISQLTLDKLIPTVIRNPKFKLIFTMNRTFEKDPVYQEITTVRPQDSLHITLNYHDNPFCPEAVYNEANLCKSIDYQKYLHIWEGQPMTSFANSIWTDEIIQRSISQLTFNRDNYSSVHIALDPATTNGEFSNEYGLIVGGKTLNGDGNVIDDLSGNYSVEDFCNKAIEGYYQYKCDCMVVEVNQGGDWLKAMLLQIDPTLNIKEVRALSAQDKVSRAKPVASLYARGIIKHINGGFVILESQMKRMTENGFIGATGESPDRVDALVWLFIDLFNMVNLETSETYIKITDLPLMKSEDITYITHKGLMYIHIDGNTAGAIVFDIIKVDDGLKICITDYDIFEKQSLNKKLTEYLTSKKYKEISVVSTASTIPIIDDFSQAYVGIKGISDIFYTKKINEKVVSVINFIQDKKILVDKLTDKTYLTNYGNLFLREITGYNPLTEQTQPLLHCLSNIIFREFNLTSE